MTRRQLRPFWSDEELATIYPAAYDHTRWDDHKVRVAETVNIVAEWAATKDPAWFDGIDLTSGDGAILRALLGRDVVQKAYYGDLVFADHLDVIGKVEDTLPAHIHGGGRMWDLYVCSETLEHVQDPDELLRSARRLATHAVFSTPIDETDAHANPEHYWSWGVEDIRAMLEAADWTPEVHKVLPLPYYNFQIWCCS